MRPTIALLRAALPSRLTILAVMVVVGVCARIIGIGIGSEWEGSDEQGIARMLIDLGVLPVFAAMLGGSLVRGEQASWAWGLARPVARWRFAATIFTADLLLLIASFLVLNGILGAVPSWVSYDWLVKKVPLAHQLAAPMLVTVAYLGAAIGAARGHATLRALPVGVAYGFAALLVAAVALWLDHALAWFFVVDAWPTPSKSGLLDTESDGHLLLMIEVLLGLATIAVAATGGLVHALVRVLGSVPAPLARRELLAILGLWISAATLLSWTLHSRVWSVGDAPPLALRGDANLVVSVEGRTHAVVLRETDCESCFARVTWSRAAIVEFRDVEPGRYRLCAEGTVLGFAPNDILRDGVRQSTRWETLETCTDVEVASGRNELAAAFDPANALPPLRPRVSGNEQQRPFEGLLLARGLAEFVFEAVRPEPRMGQGRRGAPGFARH